MKKNALKILFLALLLLPGVINAEENGITKDEIKIGSSSALSGHASFLGTQLTQGSLALINEVNRTGGIRGRKINLICTDDKYDPPQAFSNTEKLISQDKVFVLFDYVGTPTAKVIVKTINTNKMPILGFFTGAEFLRNPFQPYIINVRGSYYKEAETIVDWWFGKGHKRIAAFIQDDAFGYAVLDGVNLALSRHSLKLAALGKYVRGELPTKAELDKVIAANPDGIVMVGTYTPLALFVKQAKENGLKDAEFHTVSFVGSEAFAKELLAFQNGVEKNVYVTQVVPSPYALSNNLAKEFTGLYKKYYPQEEPNYVAMEGFVNAKILIEALNRCGKNLTRENFLKTLEKMSDYNAGTNLPCVIGPDNHSFFEKVFISEIKGRNFEILE